MSEFKGTPGPWRVIAGSGKIVEQYYPAIDMPGVQIGSASSYPNSGHFPSDEAGLANAHLIAAAPELLEALQSLKCELILSDVDMGYIESHFRPSLDKATAAIQKALGQ